MGVPALHADAGGGLSRCSGSDPCDSADRWSEFTPNLHAANSGAKVFIRAQGAWLRGQAGRKSEMRTDQLSWYDLAAVLLRLFFLIKHISGPA